MNLRPSCGHWDSSFDFVFHIHNIRQGTCFVNKSLSVLSGHMRDGGKSADQFDQAFLFVVLGEVIACSREVLFVLGSADKVVHRTPTIIGRGEVNPVPVRESHEPRDIVIALGEDHFAVGKGADEGRAISEEDPRDILVAVFSVFAVAHLSPFW